jgi:hypothetical protein
MIILETLSFRELKNIYFVVPEHTLSLNIWPRVFFFFLQGRCSREYVWGTVCKKKRNTWQDVHPYSKIYLSVICSTFNGLG